ncbi:glycerol acyltransferase [Ureibacillus massiliensis 4400831 = CIP 108448 = CCUG 49529]|uniref:Glycerol acyltransferase n=1 Tax=Ureibacillus massiliensis 4400831 = CIP 108448 = CCUG 49529 TaxID=1211035 RepID=A0A0A3J2I5_9BACL|nr:glycerol acyltransferase [Ureibacillus massiliensis]KGR89920.1 glycerol acyltransferase [Ureibacillus massiliensis 4400831 = CIP 108448 = CCUG 49529]
MKSKFYGPFVRMIKKTVRMVTPTYSIIDFKVFDDPVVYISHHQNMFGPFHALLWSPIHIHPWVLHVFSDRKECYKQYSEYTFSERAGMNKTIAKLIAYPLSFFITNLINSLRSISVNRGSRKIIQTFKESVTVLQKGEDIIIFPDIDYADASSKTKALYEGFLLIDKFYFKSTGKHIAFVPLYVSKNKKTLITSEPIYFQDGQDFDQQKSKVLEKIQASLNQMAKDCED